MIKYLLIGCWFLVGIESQAQKGLEFAVIRTSTLKLQQYYVDSAFQAPAHADDRFVELHVQLRNRSSHQIQVDLRNLQVMASGHHYAPQFVLANTFEQQPMAVIRSLEAAERKMIFSIPSAFVEDLQLVSDQPVYEYQAFTAAHVYFNDRWEQLPTPADATYYRRTAGAGNAWIVRNYFASNDQIQMEAEASQVFPLEKHGLSTWFHDNGQVQEQGFFLDDRRHGPFMEFYAHGQQKSHITYSYGKPFYEQFWDKEGQALLRDGTGEVREYNTRNNLRISYYEDHEVSRVMEIRHQEGDTLFTKTDKVPHYERGMNFLYQFIATNIKYPKAAKKNSVEGKVFVGFVIDEQGRVSEVQTLKGIGYGCDKEAERVLSKAPHWLPGEVGGVPVKTFVVLPVVFRLS